MRVFKNRSVGNNTDNFAPEGNIVGEVPRGTGIIIQANSDVEIFDNEIGENDTVNIVVTYGNDTDDEAYYPTQNQFKFMEINSAQLDIILILARES